MNSITFLAPLGATFSHDAYEELARTYGAPGLIIEPHSNYLPAPTNRDVLSMVISHGGYGAVAMETQAEGRVAEALETFIGLVREHGRGSRHPLVVKGAIELKISFCLMAWPGVSRALLNGVVAHPKALGACKQKLQVLGLSQMGVSSNGEAARLVAEDPAHRMSAALGPASAARRYGLEILETAFEDKEAITTFFLLAPPETAVVIGERNRALIVFEVLHRPGALVRALAPFEREGLNLIQIHSVHAGNTLYHFAIEVSIASHELPTFARAMDSFKREVAGHILFGPFSVLSR